MKWEKEYLREYGRKKTLKRGIGRIERKLEPKAKIKPKKASKIALWRLWNVPDWAYHRYEGIKGVYWFWFSRTIRVRDYEKFSGKCITCGLYVERGSDQACHIFAAKNCGFALLFHPLNVHLGHSHCNNPRFTPDAGVSNALTMEKRYGLDTLAELKALTQKRTKEWKREKYEEEIKKLPAYQQSLL